VRNHEGIDVRHLALPQLVVWCGEETGKYRRGQHYSPEYCFELFRRAIAERDQDAWTQLVTQYSSLVLAWILRHPARASVGEEDEFWLNDAFRRFWQATRAKQFSDFGNLPGLLAFLKMCAHSAIMDGARRQPPLPVGSLDKILEEGGEEPFADQTGQPLPEELWEAITRTLPDESERLVVYLRFGLGLSPRDIPRREPGHFPTVADVYRVYRNALDRLRRADEIRQFFA